MQTRCGDAKRRKRRANKQQSTVLLRIDLLQNVLMTHCLAHHKDVAAIVQQYAAATFVVLTPIEQSRGLLQFWNLDTLELEHTEAVDQTESICYRKPLLVNSNMLLVPYVCTSPTTIKIRFWTTNLDTYQVSSPNNKLAISVPRRADLWRLHSAWDPSSPWLTFRSGNAIFCWSLLTHKTEMSFPVLGVCDYGIDRVNRFTQLVHTTTGKLLEVQEVDLVTSSSESAITSPPSLRKVFVVNIHPTSSVGGDVHLPTAPIGEVSNFCRLGNRLYIATRAGDYVAKEHWIIDMIHHTALKLQPPSGYDSMLAVTLLLDVGSKALFQCYNQHRNDLMAVFVVEFAHLDQPPIWKPLHSCQSEYVDYVGSVQM